LLLLTGAAFMIIFSALDKIHLAQSLFFVTGGFLLPVECLPVFICLIVWMLSRYHDYCVISELTESGEDYFTGCKAKKKYSETMLELYASWGVSITPQFSSNIVCTLLAINIYVSLYRISKHHNFPLLYKTTSKKKRTWWSIFVLFAVVSMVICEVIVHLIHDTRKKLPDCLPSKFTPIEKIRLKRNLDGPQNE
jgi:hypothetical protein